jgi:hypothetical protein|tara:strand:- start:1064 stop:1321 length:258 start_codon:yes stop_codon:yes gene_type:complete
MMNNKVNKIELWAYLHMLRESGVTNMFDSPRWIVARFPEWKLGQKESWDLVMEWMDTFKQVNLNESSEKAVNYFDKLEGLKHGDI